MNLRPCNQNFVDTHYGGSLYSMTDPFDMLMLFGNLGDDYIVWDKAAHMRFRKPGKGKARPNSVSLMPPRRHPPATNLKRCPSMNRPFWPK